MNDPAPIVERVERLLLRHEELKRTNALLRRQVDVLTAEAFDSLAAEMLAKVSRGEVERNELRALASNTVEVAVDAQGRVNLEEMFRTYAGLSLGSRVIVTGAFDRVEIWDPARHERIAAEGTEKIAGADK